MLDRVAILQNQTRPVVIGFLLSIPALILCLGGIMQSLFGNAQFNEAIDFNLFIFHPIIILGGLALGFGLNALAVFRINFQLEDGSLISRIEIKGKLLSLGLIALTVGLVSIIFVYLLAENLQIFAQ